MEYLKQKDPERAWILDIEADSLVPTKIYCVVVKNLKTKEEKVFTDAEAFLSFHSPDHRYIGHNLISFDIPVLNRLWNLGCDLSVCIDTLVLSYLYNPGINGGHSLAAWGLRLGYPKGDFSDWSHYSEEMLSYCKQDVTVTYQLYTQLTEKMLRLGYTELSAEIEHKIRLIINEQEKYGCWFDTERAKDFRDFLKSEQSHLAEDIRKLFPDRRTKVAEYRLRRRKDGSVAAQYDKHRAKYSDIVNYEVDGEEWYDCYKMVPFNLGSPQQRVQRLLELGWEPTEFTKKGNPKVDEDALLRFANESGEPRIKALAEYLVVSGRLSMLAGNPNTDSVGWLGCVTEDNRIHGRVFTCGAQSRRMTHNTPNTANVPSVGKAKYGKEMRSFWGVPPGQGFSLVGYDAAGLETAGLCHYLNNAQATDILLRPKPNDVHSNNSRSLTEALGRNIDRETAKTAFYAWLYGAYPPKLGQIVKGPPSDGDIIIETFYKNVPGLKKLITDIQKEWKKTGRLRTIDGGSVICPSSGAALNYRIQSLGAILMKLTTIILEESCREKGLYMKRLLDVHDEGQLECFEKDAETIGRLAVWSIEEAGRRLNLNVNVTGDYKIGTDWSMTH